MHAYRILAGMLLLAFASLAHAAPVPACPEGTPTGKWASQADVEAHRRFEKPVLHYPYGEKPGTDDFQFGLKLQVEADGSVSCYRAISRWAGPAGPLIEKYRRRYLENLSGWHYEPFLVDGKPARSIVVEDIDEMEDVREHVALPEVPLEQVEIRMSQDECYGNCWAYELVLRGNGTATYVGKSSSDITGSHDYAISTEEFARLVDSIRREDLWSMRESYSASISDGSKVTIRLRFGGQEHSISDYFGREAGMSAGVERVEEEIQRVGRVKDWTRLSSLAMDTLEREGFDFHSTEAGAILNRAMRNEDMQPELVARLIELGAPTDVEIQQVFGSKISTMDAALETGRMELVRLLIAHGALDVDGKRSQKKIDAAFRAAISSGWLRAVQLIWDSRGSAHTPALEFDEDMWRSSPHKPATTSVSMLLYGYRTSTQPPWEGIEIARWLREKGVDLRSARSTTGETLLHRAADANNLEFTRYLLDLGVDPNTPGDGRRPAIAETVDEDVALALLEGGTDPRSMDPGRGPGVHGSLRESAIHYEWTRVLAWLDEHPNGVRRSKR